jgi:hypothetical protein
MGLPDERQTYSWVGQLQKATSPENCERTFEALALSGKSVEDFDDAKAFKSYATKVATNKATEQAVQEAQANPLKIVDSLGQPITDPTKRLKEIGEYAKYIGGLSGDPDQGHEFTLPDLTVQEALSETANA